MSDIKNYVKQAFMSPLAKTQKATHFKEISINGKQGWQACSSNDPGAQKIDVRKYPGDSIFPPPVDYMDMIGALAKAKKSVTKDDLLKQAEFTRDFGMEG